jgi:hypothetical protein
VRGYGWGGIEVCQVDECGTFKGGGGCEVDVVADKDRGTWSPAFVEAAAAIGEDQGFAAGRSGGADAMCDGADTFTFVRNIGKGGIPSSLEIPSLLAEKALPALEGLLTN